MSAMQGHRTTAAALAATCKVAYSWIVPAMYCTVVLDSPERIGAFQATLQRSKEYAESQRGARLLAQPLGAYVRHLWLGPTRVEQVCTVEATGLDVNPPFMHMIPPLCPSLLSVVVQQCASDFNLELLVDRLPQTLESLCIFPCASSTPRAAFMNAYFDIPNISRLTSLRDVTIVSRMLSSALVQRLRKMPSLCRCGGITQILKFPKAADLVLVEGRMFAYAIQQTRNAVRHHSPGVPCPLRRDLVFVVDRAQSDVNELSRRLLRTVSVEIGTSPSGSSWECPPYIAVRCMSERGIEGKELGILYDNWVTRHNPPSHCCVGSFPERHM